MENRKEVRIKKHIRIMVKDENNSCTASVTSVSKNGMSIKADYIFPTYKLLTVLIKIDQKVMPIKGSVRWVYEPPDDAEDKQYRMGLSLFNPPSEYVEFFEKMIEEAGF